MKLEGVHHITCITADAPGNVDFYVRALGLRLVKKTVNFDAPDVYHLYYGDDGARPGSLLTFFEFPQAAPGRAGAGMIHRLRWRVATRDALEFWAERLAREGVALEAADEDSLRFSDPQGLGLELAVIATDDEPLRATADDVPPEHALLGFDGVRAYARNPERSHALFTSALAFEPVESGTYRVAGGDREGWYAFDAPPEAAGVQGAGTVHHIAWASRDEDHEGWRVQALEAGAAATPIIDRQYFRSVYFREPSGVLFEIATPSPGFAIDEDADRLGEELRLPPQHEHLRPRLERTLTPLPNPRATRP